MTVWVVHPVRESLDAALQYGALRYINGRYVNADELAGDGRLPLGFRDNLYAAAQAFDPEDDYLLIAGDHLQLIQATYELVIRYDQFRVLRYDRIAQGYFPVTIGA